METTSLNARRLAENLGSTMMIMWTLILGPVGAILLGGIAYAMIVQNVTLGLACAFLLFTPLAFTIIWAPFAWAAQRIAPSDSIFCLLWGTCSQGRLIRSKRA